MYRAFNVTDFPWSNSFDEIGASIYEENKDYAKGFLESVLQDNVIDGTKLSANWFPKIEADGFISHSHSDQTKAIRLSGWLKQRFGLTSFVDSCVCGNAESLLATIDNEYCRNPDRQTYSYKKRNSSTAHVHMMLSNALNSMLNATECVFFLNTPNSITAADSVTKTRSPWLFFELISISMIQRIKPIRQKKIILERDFSKAAEFLPEYEVPLEKLTSLSSLRLIRWHRDYHGHLVKNLHPLDILYQMLPEEKTN